MKYKDLLRNTYNKIAQDWHKDHQDDNWWVKGTDTLCSLLQTKALILDVGCGAGTKSKYLTKKGFRVTGIDFAEKQLAIAENEVPNAHFEVLDVYDLDSHTPLYDAVFAQAVLLHIPKKDVDVIFKKLVRKVKSKGYLYVAVKEIKQDQSEEEIKKEQDYGYIYERFFSYFTLPEMEKYFKQNDLQVVLKERELFGKTTWIQIIGQKS